MMNSAERIRQAMNITTPDRMPLMCQPSWGFVLTQLPEVSPIDHWYNKNGIYPRSFADISFRFHFDGVLIPAVGLAALKEEKVAKEDQVLPGGPSIYFQNGDQCIYCRDDLPRYFYKNAPEISIDELNPDEIPDSITYHTPSNHLRMHMNDDEPGRIAEILQLREYMGNELSIHGSTYAPEDYLIDRLGVEEAFLAMMTHPGACLLF